MLEINICRWGDLSPNLLCERVIYKSLNYRAGGAYCHFVALNP